MKSEQRLLDRFRVLDLSQYIPGPFATRQMADLGADVIKVEPPYGDPMRTFLAHSEPVSPLYRHLNRGKRIVFLDLKSEQGKEKLRSLITDADVLLESFRPGVLARLGFDREALKTLNPCLVHCALSGFGQNGPYRDRAGHDLTYSAVSGALSLSGTVDQPVMSYPPLADHAGAMQALTTVLAALLKRESDNKGRFLDISLTEAAMSWQYLGLHEKRGERQAQLLNGGAAYYNIYQTSDAQFIALAALEKKFWQAFCEAIDEHDWIERQGEALPQRALMQALTTKFLQHPLSYWNNRLHSIDCCYEPIPSFISLGSHPQITERGLLHGNEPSFPAHIDGKPTTLNQEPQEVTTKEIKWLQSPSG